MARAGILFSIGLTVAVAAVWLGSAGRWVSSLVALFASCVLIARARYVLTSPNELPIRTVADDTTPSWGSVLISEIRSEGFAHFVFPLLVPAWFALLQVLAPSVAAAVPDAERPKVVAVMMLATYWVVLVAMTIVKFADEYATRRLTSR